MSDRDFIIQEIRKLFKEQSNKNTSKVTPAKDARSTKDLPFQQINIPSEYQQQYQQVTAGMDRGETGECPFINQAAIKVLGDDPKVIYTALINSGVLPANYVPPSKPCEGLGELIRNFQYLATQNKLRYQKKIDPTGDIAKKLAYKPEVPTPDLQKQAATAIAQQKGPTIKQQQIAKGATNFVGPQQPTKVVKTPARTNLQEQAVSVDGKIGSRTAELLKIYADKSSFEGLKKKAGVVPTAPVKKTTTTTSKKTTTARTTTTGACNFWVQDADDLKRQISQTMFGVPCGELDIRLPKQKKWNMIINKSHFNGFRSSTLDGIPIDNNDIQPFEQVMNRYKNGLKTKAANVIAFVVKKANQKEKARIEDLTKKFSVKGTNFAKALELSKKQDPPIKVPKEMWTQDDIGFITNSLGDMTVTLYLSDIGFKRALNFTIFSKMNPQTGRPDSYIPIIWSTYPSAASIEAGFIMGGLKGLELLGVDNPFQINKKHFKNDSAEVNKTLKSVYDVYNICKKYESDYNTASNTERGNLEVLSKSYMKEDGIKTLRRYIYKLKELINRIRDFQANPNPETLEKLGKICMSVSPMWANYDRIDYL
jgi:hypothetical protein